ncbi:hypothetical protein [Spirochaeta lutea]|uniref:Uncharacterized protein n=1 Tax=Spirochaeta lutea TaxID=1480694 RepID=A0A098QUN3_9SPIO|nr:hypothetical protein [Spirochaeta lutea]KGE71113.1 hypothetical protein DC28_12745 [Spirochaeta lutea]
MLQATLQDYPTGILICGDYFDRAAVYDTISRISAVSRLSDHQRIYLEAVTRCFLEAEHASLVPGLESMPRGYGAAAFKLIHWLYILRALRQWAADCPTTPAQQADLYRLEQVSFQAIQERWPDIHQEVETLHRSFWIDNSPEFTLSLLDYLQAEFEDQLNNLEDDPSGLPLLILGMQPGSALAAQWTEALHAGAKDLPASEQYFQECCQSPVLNSTGIILPQEPLSA